MNKKLSFDLESMSLQEKIGQMLLIGFRGTECPPGSMLYHAIHDHHVGAVWLTENESVLPELQGNIDSFSQVQSLISDLQNAARIPLFVSIDAEGGEVIRFLPKYGFPATRTANDLATQGTTRDTLEQARLISQWLVGMGFNMNLAPVLDLNLDPLNPALGAKQRCYGDTPNQVIRHARQVIKAHRKANILSVAKHFPGQGSAVSDTHLEPVDVTKEWRDAELEPFRHFIESESLDGIMVSYVLHRNMDPQYPASLSRSIVQGLLRDRMGFQGLVICDDLDMGAIKNHYSLEHALLLAVNAGVDMITISNLKRTDMQPTFNAIDILKRLVLSGEIKQDQIDRACKRILAFKERF